MSTGPSFLGEILLMGPQGRHQIGLGTRLLFFFSILASFHHKKPTTACHDLTTLSTEECHTLLQYYDVLTGLETKNAGNIISVDKCLKCVMTLAHTHPIILQSTFLGLAFVAFV